MSTLRVVEFTNPDVLSVYPSVLALTETTKNDSVPFNPNIITKLLVTFEDHLKSIKPVKLAAPDFKNMFYTLIEEQAQNGFLIPLSLKDEMTSYRKTMKTNALDLKLQTFLIHSAKFG
jgi:hypothetical protein